MHTLLKKRIESSNLEAERDELAKAIGQKAAHLFKSGKFLCAEAILITINEAFGGGLTKRQVLALSAPFCEGLGQSGCLCGALSGAVMACSMILINFSPWKRRELSRKIAYTLHGSFKAENKSTCCRVLTRHVRNDKKQHLKQCADLTARAAEMAALFITEEHPSLVSMPSRKDRHPYGLHFKELSSWITNNIIKAIPFIKSRPKVMD